MGEFFRFGTRGPWTKAAKPSVLRRAFGNVARVAGFLALGTLIACAALYHARGTFAAVVDPVRDAVRETLREVPALPKVVRHTPPAARDSFSAIDGDSLRSGGEDIRLLGIDAPELYQTCNRAGRRWACGREAHARLRALVAGGAVACIPEGRDRYGRTLARCRAGGTDLGETMVREGFALDFMGGGYAAAEREARDARRGIWAGDFDLPQDWRRRSGPRASVK